MEFSELEESDQQCLQEILSGKVVGRQVCHIWYESDTESRVFYNGIIEKLKRKGGGTYVAGYLNGNDGSTYDDAEDYDVSKFALAADFICKDLVMS